MNETDVPKVISKMLTEQEKILSVEQGETEDGLIEYYFTFPGDKYLWSVLEFSNGRHRLFYYPTKENRSNFLIFDEQKMNVEERRNLDKLFSVLRNKLYGFDKVLNDILGS